MINGSYAYDWLYLRKELIGRGLSVSVSGKDELTLDVNQWQTLAKAKADAEIHFGD